MNQATATPDAPVSQVTDATGAVTHTDATVSTKAARKPRVAKEKAPVEPKAPREPSLKSRAVAIFQAKITERAQGLFATNREFRGAVLAAIVSQLEVSMASAATMYNAAKKEAEAADATVNLGRDPKKEKAPSTGKRGRPAGSKNKAKEVTAEAAPAADTSEVEAAPTQAEQVAAAEPALM